MTEIVIGSIDTIYKEDSVETVATEFNPVQRTSDIENNISESLLRENKVKRTIPVAIFGCALFVIFSLVFVIIVSVLK
jgi:flagellar biosynthesis/type III secretory pathway M-ring protein FliF/YscJ